MPDVPGQWNAGSFVSVPGLSTLDESGHASINVAASVTAWEPNRFNQLIRTVADDQSSPVLFANLRRRTAYAPYDGGADLYLESPEAVARLKMTWKDWLSGRPDGL